MQLQAAFRIHISCKIKRKFLFTDFDFQNVSLVYRHIPRAIKYNPEDKNILTFFHRRFVPIRIHKLFQR
jgi:hypothetical protein